MSFVTDRRGPKVSVIKRIPHAYVTDIGTYVIVSARHGFKEFNFLYRSEGGVGGGKGVLKRFQANRFPVSLKFTPFPNPWPPISLALSPPPYSKHYYACDNICMQNWIERRHIGRGKGHFCTFRTKI